MMMPKKVKFRKQQRGRRRGLATRGQKISFGDFGLQALEAGWVTARQVEAGRIAMTRHLKRGGERRGGGGVAAPQRGGELPPMPRHIKRGGKIWIRIFPDKLVTKKPLET